MVIPWKLLANSKVVRGDAYPSKGGICTLLFGKG